MNPQSIILITLAAISLVSALAALFITHKSYNHAKKEYQRITLDDAFKIIEPGTMGETGRQESKGKTCVEITEEYFGLTEFGY